jgi:transcriptional regulator with XRE-family HTH domain
MTFAAQLRQLLDDRGLTQLRAAALIGQSPRTLQEWAQGRRAPKPYAQGEILRRISAAVRARKSRKSPRKPP